MRTGMTHKGKEYWGQGNGDGVSEHEDDGSCRQSREVDEREVVLTQMSSLDIEADQETCAYSAPIVLR